MDKLRKKSNFISNWKGLLCLVILLYFTSCKENDPIGLILEDGETLAATTFTDTISIETSISLIDTVYTTMEVSRSRESMLIGRVENDTFGITTANAYSRLVLPSIDAGDSLFFDEGQVFDSAKIVLPYFFDFGNGNASQTFEVYELTEAVDIEETYFHTSSLAFENTLIGQKTFVPANDTTGIVEIRVDGLGEKVFNASKTQALVDSVFEDVLKGITIRPAAGNSGYILAVGPRSENLATFNMRIFSSAPGDTVATVTPLFFGRRFHQVEKDFSGTPLEGLGVNQSVDTEAVGGKVLVEYMAGLTTKITFPGLENFADGREVLINRAELVFEPSPSSINKFGLPPSNLAFFYADESGNLNPSNFIGTDAFELGAANSPTPALAPFRISGRTYDAVRMTYYIQQLVNGNRPNNGIYIGLLTGTNTLRKAMVENELANEDLRFRLEVYYTVF